MMNLLVPILAALLLTACGGMVPTGEVAQYDLGILSGKGTVSRVPIAEVDVQAASWLAGPAMYFRLAYADPLRRQSYAESRWAAPPAELLEGFIKRRIVFGQTGFSGAGCRLQLVIDELEQRFDDPQKSHVVLEVRVQLTPRRAAEVLARRVFLIQKPAALPVARGGVAAAREAVQALTDDLGGWMNEIERDTPALVERCRT
jgi:cholesterol transport system auxiliary component